MTPTESQQRILRTTAAIISRDIVGELAELFDVFKCDADGPEDLAVKLEYVIVDFFTDWAKARV